MINFSYQRAGKEHISASLMHVGRTEVPIIALISWSSSLLPVVVGWKRWKNLTRETRILLALLSFYIPFLAVELWTTFNGIKNLWMGDAYTLLEFAVLATVFSRWSTDEVVRRIMRSSVAVVVMIWLIGKFSFEPLGGNSNYVSPLETLILISMALYTIIGLVRGNVEILFGQPQFWVSVGVIVYGAGMLPLYIVSTKLLALPLREYEKVWNINWILQFITNLVYVLVFLCRENVDVPPRHGFRSDIPN